MIRAGTRCEVLCSISYLLWCTMKKYNFFIDSDKGDCYTDYTYLG